MVETTEANYDRLMREMQEFQEKQEERKRQKEIDDQRIKETLANSEQVFQNYADFKQNFTDVNQKIVESIALPGGKNEVLKGFDGAALSHQPIEISSGKEAAEYLKDSKRICILTGAGLSAASGVPTFRGSGGFWTKSYGGIDDPM